MNEWNFVQCDVSCGSGKKLKEGDSKLNLFFIFDTEFICENPFDSHNKLKHV